MTIDCEGMTTETKVLIISSSGVFAELLRSFLSSDYGYKIIGVVKTVEPALELSADVVILDIFIPKAEEFEALRLLMRKTTIPLLVICPKAQRESIEKYLNEIGVGNLAVIEKLESDEAQDYGKMSQKVMSGLNTLVGGHHHPKQREKSRETGGKSFILRQISAVAIGSSLGGPRALNEILSKLNRDFPVPILITQHISNGFSESLVEWLATTSSFQVLLAKDGEIALPGYAYVAPENFHMEITSHNVIHLSVDPPEGGLRPAVSRLFRSMANVLGPKGVGVMLTGMGSDGAQELLMMKEKGAMTIAQNEESCAVFGMPQKAIALGAATVVLPLEEIASALEAVVGAKRR